MKCVHFSSEFSQSSKKITFLNLQFEIPRLVLKTIKKTAVSFRILALLLSSILASDVVSAQIQPNFSESVAYPAAVTSVTVDMPAGSEVNDLLFVHIVTDDDGAIAEPAAFTQVAEFWQGTNGPTNGIYYRVIDGTESSSYDFTFPSEPAVVTVLRYSKDLIDTSIPIHASAMLTGNNATPTAPSITTTVNNRTILQFIAVDGASAGVLTSNNPGNLVVSTAESGATGGAEMMITTSTQATAGATPVGNYSFASEQWAAFTLALNDYFVEITSPSNLSCAMGSTTITASYSVPNSSGNFELVDPLGMVLATEAYTSSSGMVSFTYTPSISGNYIIREQSIPEISNALTIYIDSDGDTVCDLFDIDDDNDGVIDNVESPNCFLSLSDVPFESGDLTSLIQVSTEWTVNNGTLSNILNGNTGDNAVRKSNGDFTFTGQEFLKFSLPTAVTFDAITIHHEGAVFLDLALLGTVQGSNDGTNWTDLTVLGTVLPDDVSPHTITLTQNLADYSYYRIFVNSGRIDDDEYLREVEFSMDFVPTNYPLSLCTDDVDGDLIPNHLDLDTDGDGCSDALEAGATTTLTPDFQFPINDSGANGLPDMVETMPESGAINYISTYIPQAVFSGITGCVDRDGDSVVDALDDDIDNDGILNSVEDGYCNINYNLAANKSQIQISSNTGLGGSGGIDVLLNDNTGDNTFWYTNSNWTGDEIVRLEFPVPAILTGLEYWIGDDHMQDYGTVTKIQGSDDGVNWVDMSPNAEFTMVAPDNTPGVLSAAPHAHTFLWDNDTPYLFYRQLGVSGGGNPTPFVNELFFRTESPVVCDYDEDGVPNSADLDSDGDGIPDNVEAQTTAGYTAPNSDSPMIYDANDGVNTAYLGGLPLPDTNLDLLPDFLDTESDDDRILDADESGFSLTGIVGMNGLDMAVETSDDYTDVNGVVDNPSTDLASNTTLTSEVDYRDKMPPPEVILCYNGVGNQALGGSTMTFHDEKLENPDNWGEFGLSYFDITAKDLGNANSITPALLVAEGCQVFYLGGNTSDGADFDTITTTLTPASASAIRDWAASANNVLITFQGLSVYMGGEDYGGQNGNVNPNSLTELGEIVVSGEFGQTNDFTQGGSFQGHFTSFPSSACAFTQDNSSPNPRPTGIINSETGDFYLADFGILSETGGMTNAATITSNNDILFANLISSALRVVQEGPPNVCNFFLCPAGDDAPVLTATDISSSGTPVDLNTLYSGTPPVDASFTWHTMSPVADQNYLANSSSYTQSGVVYAAFRANDGSCYSPSTPVMVTVNYPDLEVGVSPADETSSSGEVQSFTVTVTNNGPITAPDAIVKIPIPLGRQLVLANPSAGSYDGSTYLWSVGELLNGESETLEITIKL